MSPVLVPLWSRSVPLGSRSGLASVRARIADRRPTSPAGPRASPRRSPRPPPTVVIGGPQIVPPSVFTTRARSQRLSPANASLAGRRAMPVHPRMLHRDMSHGSLVVRDRASRLLAAALVFGALGAVAFASACGASSTPKTPSHSPPAPTSASAFSSPAAETPASSPSSKAASRSPTAAPGSLLHADTLIRRSAAGRLR